MTAATRSTGSTSCRRATTSPDFPTRCASCSRTCFATGDDADVEAVARWNAKAEPSRGDLLHARRVCSCRTSPAFRRSSTSLRCATRWPTWAASRSKINPLIPAELVIDHSVQVDAFASRHGVRAERRARVRAQPRALPVPALGAEGVRQLPGRAAGHRHLPPGEPRVPRARRRGPRRSRVPRHARRHRLAHDDGQRPRRARLGRRRHRGRGGDARPAALDARPAGRRLPAERRAARRRDRDRPRPDRDRDAPQDGRRRQVRRVLRRRASRRCRSPTARRSGTCRRSTARPAASSRSTT